MNVIAWFLVLIHIFVYGSYPAFIAFIPSGAFSPLAFLTISYLVALPVGLIQIASIFAHSTYKNRDDRVTMRRLLHGMSPRFYVYGALSAVFNAASFGCLFYAIQDNAVFEASALYQLYATVYLISTMVMGRLVAKNDPDDPRKFKLMQGAGTTALFFVVGAIGVVTIGTARHIESIFYASVSSVAPISISTLTIAILAPVLMGACMWCAAGGSHELKKQLSNQRKGNSEGATNGPTPEERILAGAVLSAFERGIGGLGALFLWLLIGDGSFSFDAATQPPGLELVFACGILMGVGGVLWAVANNISRNSNINLMMYFEPFVAFLILNYLGLIPHSAGLAYFGAILVLTANFVLTSGIYFSLAFRVAILSFCAGSTIVRFRPIESLEPDTGLIGTVIGLFGIIAAFLTDRLIRSEELSKDSVTGFHRTAQNIFVLWILAFGALILLLGFRPGTSVQYDFFAVTITIAIVYIAVMPIDLALGAPPTNNGTGEAQSNFWTLAMSAAFIAGLFVLLLLSLLGRAAVV